MSDRARTLSRTTALALVADVVVIVVFAAIGRAEHDTGNPILGVLATAWPFLAGAALGWVVVTLAGKRLPISPGPGITVWLTTVIVGMLLRQVTDQGTATAFIVVATLVLGALMLGWRLAYALWLRRRNA